MMEEFKESNEQLAEVSKSDLPAWHLEGIADGKFDLADVARHVFSAVSQLGAGLVKAWDALTGGEQAEQIFSQAYQDYVSDPIGLLEQHPEIYGFLKDHVFYGQEYFTAGDELGIIQGAEALSHLEAIRPEVWEDLSTGERLQALQTVEETLAKVQGRPALEVVCEPMEPGMYGYFDGRAIHLSEWAMNSNDVAEAVDTIAHEGRHAFQHFAVDHPGFYPDQATVAAWGENFDNYLTADLYGQEIYQSQPVEADAWAYGSAIRQALYA